VHLDEEEGELRRVWIGVPEIAEDEEDDQSVILRKDAQGD
jgi:hypothetical protein